MKRELLEIGGIHEVLKDCLHAFSFLSKDTTGQYWSLLIGLIMTVLKRLYVIIV